MRKILAFIILLSSLNIMLSCKQKESLNNNKQLTVSIIPQKYLANFIAGDKFAVQVMQPIGSNHETYEPTPRDMEKISASKLYLALGALDFEIAWIDRFKASNPAMKIIDTSEGIQMICGHHHDENEGDKHQNHGIDPHTWLSPSCMKIQAANISKALSTVDSANASFYRSNLTRFNQTADSIDRLIREKLAGSEGKSILIFHPAFAYFARDYNLTQISIEQDGKEPSPAYMAELIKTALDKKITAVFISKEFDTRNAEVLAREIKGKIVVFDPMDENWAENMLHLADLIASN